MEMNKNQNINIEDQSNDQAAAEDTQNAERMYTSAEVNEMIRKRLAREKKKAANGNDAEVQLRSARLDCKEYVIDNGLPKELLDVIDTSDFAAFKEKAEKMRGVISKTAEESAPGYPDVKDGGSVPRIHDDSGEFAKAFSGAVKHKPKQPPFAR